MPNKSIFLSKCYVIAFSLIIYQISCKTTDPYFGTGYSDSTLVKISPITKVGKFKVASAVVTTTSNLGKREHPFNTRDSIWKLRLPKNVEHILEIALFYDGTQLLANTRPNDAYCPPIRRIFLRNIENLSFLTCKVDPANIVSTKTGNKVSSNFNANLTPRGQIKSAYLIPPEGLISDYYEDYFQVALKYSIDKKKIKKKIIDLIQYEHFCTKRQRETCTNFEFKTTEVKANMVEDKSSTGGPIKFRLSDNFLLYASYAPANPNGKFWLVSAQQPGSKRKTLDLKRYSTDIDYLILNTTGTKHLPDGKDYHNKVFKIADLSSKQALILQLFKKMTHSEAQIGGGCGQVDTPEISITLVNKNGTQKKYWDSNHACKRRNYFSHRLITQFISEDINYGKN